MKYPSRLVREDHYLRRAAAAKKKHMPILRMDPCISLDRIVKEEHVILIRSNEKITSIGIFFFPLKWKQCGHGIKAVLRVLRRFTQSEISRSFRRTRLQCF